jgi:hypothetical protein
VIQLSFFCVVEEALSAHNESISRQVNGKIPRNPDKNRVAPRRVDRSEESAARGEDVQVVICHYKEEISVVIESRRCNLALRCVDEGGRLDSETFHEREEGSLRISQALTSDHLNQGPIGVAPERIEARDGNPLKWKRWSGIPLSAAGRQEG